MPRRIRGAFLALLLLGLVAACAEQFEPWQPVGALTVEVTGDDYCWYFRYPGRDGRLGTDDDIRATGPLHVPVNTSVELQLTSVDYIYSLELPAMGLAEIAAPGLSFSLELHTDREGRFPLLGDQFCGYAHETLITELIVESESAFKEFLDATRRRN